jgi:hypothetical protein
MSGHNRKKEILESRGKRLPVRVHNELVEPNQRGGCSKSKIIIDGDRFKFVLVDGRPCDSVTKWMSEGVEHEHRWSATGPVETPWMTGSVESHKWQLLGPPSVAAMVWNFGRAMAKASNNGFKKLPDSIIESRLAICRGCDYWNEHVRFGFGKCSHPGCGCTKSKLWVASEECPQKLWLAVDDGETEVLTG